MIYNLFYYLLFFILIRQVFHILPYIATFCSEIVLFFQTCRPKTAGSLCRAADYECDLPEFCTGQSEYCPADIYKMDTEICDDGKVINFTLLLWCI